MPTPIKAGVSLLALIVALVFAYFQRAAGHSDVAWVAVATGVFAVIAMWLFPEAEKKQPEPPKPLD